MDVFSNSYDEARGKFLVACAEAGARVASYPLAGLQGENGEALAADVACVGPSSAERVALIISGTHGDEGFCGSAIQTRWLSQARSAHGAVKIVLVHAINPWAFSHRTRANEDNIDLNRNFIEGGADALRGNPTYDAIAHILHADPSKAARALELHRSYRAYFDEHGWDRENEVWQGQWHRADGFLYGGRAAWSNTTFRRILREHLAGASTVGFIDWHTGLGQFGEIVHLVFDDRESAAYQAAAAWWGLEESGGAAFKAGAKPKYQGLLCQAIHRECPGARVAGAVIEFGTVDDYSLFRAELLDRWLRFEGRDHPDARLLRQSYQDALFPPDISWRRQVEQDGPRLMDELVRGVGAW